MAVEEHKESYLLSRWIFLRTLGLIHFVAFLSLSVQILMLNGKHGILPIVDLLARVKQAYGAEAYSILPTIFWLNSSDQFILGTCIAGVVLSILVQAGILTGPCLLILAALYLSLDNAGGEFMAFQSDGLIVEASLLALFLVPWCLMETPWRRSHASMKEPSKLGLVINRFLLFRLMLAAGLVKILSGDPTWQDLTALSYHQETQPIPTPLAWLVHHFPMWMHKSAVLFTFFVELVAPLFYFGPRRLRLIAAFSSIALHVGILLTGNYTFLNYLSIVLCLPLIDDGWYEKLIPGGWGKRLRARLFDGEHGAGPPLKTNLNKLSAGAFQCSVVSLMVLAACRFFMSLGIYVPAPVMTCLLVLEPYRLINSYGMFAVMTTTRPEIVFEGSEDGKDWKPYTFKYKVDELNKPPPVVAPHMPRLDWRLWFASMNDVSQSPWVLNVARLLLKREPCILSAFRSNPFPDSGPKYLRAYVYDYHLSDWTDLFEKGLWWRRDNKRLYFPPIMLDEDGEIIPARL